MEYRDLYDENRNLTGEKILTGEKVPSGRYYITVVVFIENNNNQLLLQVVDKVVYSKWICYFFDAHFNKIDDFYKKY